jgi:hypothetical protein
MLTTERRRRPTFALALEKVMIEVTELKEQEHRGDVKPPAAPVMQASVSAVLGAPGVPRHSRSSRGSHRCAPGGASSGNADADCSMIQT